MFRAVSEDDVDIASQRVRRPRARLGGVLPFWNPISGGGPEFANSPVQIALPTLVMSLSSRNSSAAAEWAAKKRERVERAQMLREQRNAAARTAMTTGGDSLVRRTRFIYLDVQGVMKDTGCVCSRTDIGAGNPTPLCSINIRRTRRPASKAR